MKHSGKKTSVALAVLALTTLAFAMSASAEEVFVHFEQLAPGDSVAGLGTVYQDLDIQPLNSSGPLRVIQTFWNAPELVVYRAPNTDPWWKDSDMAINDSLEDEDGNIVCAHPPEEWDGSVAQGFADTGCSWLGWDDGYWCPQELRITFGDRRVYKFKMLMVDYGDWNPAHSADHKVALRGFDGGVEVAVPYTIEYTIPDPDDITPDWFDLGFDPRVEADACLCDGSGLGHTPPVVTAPPWWFRIQNARPIWATIRWAATCARRRAATRTPPSTACCSAS